MATTREPFASITQGPRRRRRRRGLAQARSADVAAHLVVVLRFVDGGPATRMIQCGPSAPTASGHAPSNSASRRPGRSSLTGGVGHVHLLPERRHPRARGIPITLRGCDVAANCQTGVNFVISHLPLIRLMWTSALLSASDGCGLSLTLVV